MKQISKPVKIFDIVMRVVYIGIFTLTGVWALIFPTNYAKELGMTITQPMGRGEIGVIGSVYLLSALIFFYNWLKKQDSELYKIPSFVIGAIVLSRSVSVIKVDFDQELLIIFVSEVLLLAWAFWGLRRNMRCKGEMG